MSVKYIDIDDIKGAEYNPREIKEEKLETLKESIEKLGFILPIIVNKENNTIVAGHQRTKTAKKLGIKKVPAFIIEGITISDEINFNQLHNGAENNSTYTSTIISDKYKKGTFQEIDPDDINVSRDIINAQVVSHICKLIETYGNVFSIIISNDVIVFQEEYAYACKILNKKCNAYICKSEDENDVKKYFSQDYGKFYYSNLEKNTFVQGLAQMHRSLSKEKGNKKKANASVLYEKMVFPYLEKKYNVKSILDFGCGKGTYVNHLDKRYEAIGVEFYNNNGKQINVSKGNKQIDRLIKYLQNRKEKYFDVVVCDSVLNSVDSLEAESAVMTIVNLFTKDIAFVSGITLKKALRQNERRKVGANMDNLRFLDDNNFTASFRNGQWYYQHFHSQKDVYKLAKRHGFIVEEYFETSSAWKVKLKKVKELTKEEYIKAIDFEFNLPLPNNKTYNRHEDVKRVIF